MSYRLNVLTTLRKTAFTLAEVLITLGVIGVVAAMTIPTLISNYQEKATVTKVKKFYSTISQAYQLATIEHGKPSEWGLQGRLVYEENDDKTVKKTTSNIFLRDIFLKNFKVLKTCDNVYDQKDCGVADNYYYMNGDYDDSVGKVSASALLADGTTIIFMTNLLDGDSSAFNRGEGVLKSCWGNIDIDINGIKEPNTFGKDLFMFYITNENIMPVGTQSESKYTFADNCLDANAANHSGVGCSAWVVYNGNMDYLKCDDLSWEGKHKCSD